MNNAVYCSTHQMGKYPKVVIIAILSAFPTLGVALIVCSIFASYSTIVYDGYPASIGFMLFASVGGTGCALFVIGWQFIMAGMTKYRFTKEGIYAKYPLKPEQLLYWDSFQQVCVCYAAYTTRGRQKANTVICCVKHGERKNFYGRWKTDNPFRYSSVICIDYSPALLNGIKDMCPYEVIDLRETPVYKLR